MNTFFGVLVFFAVFSPIIVLFSLYAVDTVKKIIGKE